ncbi:hypothetical protein B0H19DRAFT_1376292 [Mycena capillaripes]|nr:hypothetical protein B0H19DRAFT_1376292 [Mycena capillaripes]
MRRAAAHPRLADHPLTLGTRNRRCTPWHGANAAAQSPRDATTTQWEQMRKHRCFRTRPVAVTAAFVRAAPARCRRSLPTTTLPHDASTLAQRLRRCERPCATPAQCSVHNVASRPLEEALAANTSGLPSEAYLLGPYIIPEELTEV